jgi:AraC-like DNA-binding protein
MDYRSPTGLFRWSTDDVPRAQRFDYFAEALSSALAPMQLESDARATLAARLTGVDLGPLAIIHQTGTEHRSYREEADVARNSGHTFHLIVNRGAAWQIEHCGHAFLAPGDAVLADSNFGHRIDIRSDFELLHLKLSAAWVGQWLGDPVAWVGRHISANRPWAHALSGFVQTLAPEFVLRSRDVVAPIGDHLGALLSLVGGELLDSRTPFSRGDAALRELIHDGISQRSGEASLSADDIARPLSVSAREVHRCLAVHGETFAQLLRDSRLAVVQRMLQSRQFRRMPIAEIVARAGLPEGTIIANLSDPFAMDRGIVAP